VIASTLSVKLSSSELSFAASGLREGSIVAAGVKQDDWQRRNEQVVFPYQNASCIASSPSFTATSQYFRCPQLLFVTMLRMCPMTFLRILPSGTTVCLILIRVSLESVTSTRSATTFDRIPRLCSHTSHLTRVYKSKLRVGVRCEVFAFHFLDHLRRFNRILPNEARSS
jgi:hypothetical protein